MSSANINLPDREFPRRYVAPDAVFDTWPAAESYYRELHERPISSVDEFERWLIDFSEVDAVFDEERVSRNIETTRATDDKEREKRFIDFIENVFPHREPWHEKLRQKFVELAGKFALSKKRYEVLERSIRNAIELFREENIPLQVEHVKLIQRYRQITGAMTATYQGEEMTLQQLGRHLEEPDRQVREETYRLAADRFLQDAKALDDLYDEMVKLRDTMARNADCQDYREFAFRAMERFDYTPEDCLTFHDAIEQVVSPAVLKLADERKAKLGVDTLRPWDMQVDPENRPPLRPFEKVDRLMDGCSQIFQKVNRELGQTFATLRERDLLDLDSRKGKAPGGYQETYTERRVPFIFMNAVGTESDVRTLLHEGGHAFHTWACRNDPLDAYRSYPIEFAEVASMGMELLALPHIDEFYGDETKRAKKSFLKGIVRFFPFMACVDALQHWVYTHVDASPEDRKDEWVRLSRRFMPHVDWTGLEAYSRHSWHRKLHFFEVPFYYVEYGIAQLGALEVWMNTRKDYDHAVALYRNGLALGGSRPLPELFEAAGLRFDFSERTLRPLIEAVMEEIERL
ncbi:MAG: M3 family oligoendopeptidase [Planctomycetes bacterium]|nr:M3 family oligoendopeptidase [Planctomycetota bacterium]